MRYWDGILVLAPQPFFGLRRIPPIPEEFRGLGDLFITLFIGAVLIFVLLHNTN